MAFTTRDFPVLYSPTGDPTLDLGGRLYIPDPALFPGPYHCMVGTNAPGFQGDGSFNGLSRPFTDMAAEGILCLAFGCRSVIPIPGQTTTGVYPQQTDDCKQVIRMMRQGAWIETEQGFSVTGFVGITGPSGAAGHAVFCVVNGTAGDDRADACIGCSPVTNYADRETDALDGIFIDRCAVYGDLVDTDLVGLRAKSPIAFCSSLAKPCLVYIGTQESMPLSQVSGVDGLTVNMVAAGAVNYEFHLNDGEPGRPPKKAHGFAQWPYVSGEAITWLKARMAEFNGEDPEEPPPETGRVLVTAVISGLAPDVAFKLNVGAHDNVTTLDGPITSFDFISDPAGGGSGGKPAPVGVYALVDAPEGVITGNIATRAWLGFTYVNGATLPTTWRALNPTSRESFDWSQTDAFLAACGANNKKAGISVSMGIKTPQWYFSTPGVHFFTVHEPNFGNIPIPWDPKYLGACKGFIQAFATKYDGNTALSYITVGGMGQLLDTLLVQSPADYTELNNSAISQGFPDLISAWAQISQGVLDIWAKSFKTTRVILPINLPVPSLNGGLVGIDEFTRASITHYKTRMGIMTLELDGLTAADSNLSLNSIIRDANRSFRAYRFLWPSSDPNCDPSQEPETYDPELGLQNAANAGINLGVQMEEFYEVDVLNVSGNYPSHFSDFKQDLEANEV